MTASLLVCSALAGGTLAPAPAGSAENVRHTVWLSDAGFSVREIKAQAGDRLVFQLDVNNVAPGSRHTVTWDLGRLEKELTPQDDRWEIPLNSPGTAVYWDRFHYTKANPNASAFFGRLDVAPAPKPDPSTSTTTTSSTTTTTAPTTTTTSTLPTTTTTAKPIEPQSIPDPTTTTTAAPAPPPTTGQEQPPAAPPSTAGDDKPKDKNKSKDKAKDKGKDDKAPDTTATTDPALADVPPELFDAAMLTPGPSVFPETFDEPSEGEATINAAAVVSLLDAPRAEDDDSRVMLLLVLGGVGALLLLVIGWAWFTRSSNYDPA